MIILFLELKIKSVKKSLTLDQAVPKNPVRHQLRLLYPLLCHQNPRTKALIFDILIFNPWIRKFWILPFNDIRRLSLGGASSYKFGVLTKIVRHLKQKFQDGEDHPLSTDELLDETNQLDVSSKVRMVRKLLLSYCVWIMKVCRYYRLQFNDCSGFLRRHYPIIPKLTLRPKTNFFLDLHYLVGIKNLYWNYWRNMTWKG